MVLERRHWCLYCQAKGKKNKHHSGMTPAKTTSVLLPGVNVFALAQKDSPRLSQMDGGQIVFKTNKGVLRSFGPFLREITRGGMVDIHGVFTRTTSFGMMFRNFTTASFALLIFNTHRHNAYQWHTRWKACLHGETQGWRGLAMTSDHGEPPAAEICREIHNQRIAERRKRTRFWREDWQPGYY